MNNQYVNVTPFMIALTAIFVACKLMNVVAWSWLWVLSPLWFPFAFVCVFWAIFWSLFILLALISAITKLL
jgi:hypothetical protein